jgi:cytochrome P450
MHFPIVSLTGSCLAILFALYVFRVLHRSWQRYRLRSQEGCRPCPSYAQKDPVWGLDTLWETIQGFKNGHYLDLLVKRHNQYGRTFAFTQLGETTISTCDPGVMKCVLSTHFKDFSTGDLRSNSLTPILGQGILTIDGDQWRHQRALIRPSFARAQVKDLDIFERTATELIQAVKAKNCNVDIQDLVQRMVLDANIEYLFGDSLGLLGEKASETAQVLNESLDCALEGVIYRLRLGKLMFLHWDPKFWRACKTIHTFAEKYVAQALQLREREKLAGVSGTPEKYILLNEMAKDTNDPILLRDEIVTMIAAARDTTSATISFALYLLARTPDIWAKLRAEVLNYYVKP